MKTILSRLVRAFLAAIGAAVLSAAVLILLALSGVYDPSVPFAAMLVTGCGWWAGSSAWRPTA